MADAMVVWHPCPKCGPDPSNGHFTKPRTTYSDLNDWICVNPECDWRGARPAIERPERRDWKTRDKPWFGPRRED